MLIDSDRQVFELRLLILKRKSTCTSGCDRFTTKSKSQRNSNFGMKTWKTKKIDGMGTKMQIWNAASIRIPGERASDEIRRSEVLKNVRQGWVRKTDDKKKTIDKFYTKEWPLGILGGNRRTTLARHQLKVFGRKCLSPFVSDLLSSIWPRRCFFSSWLLTSLDLTKIHAESLIGKQISTTQGIFFLFELINLKMKCRESWNHLLILSVS